MDRIAHLRLSSVILPLATPISDAKVLTGRQKPMTEIAMLFAEVHSAKLDAEPHLLVPAVAQRAKTQERHRFLVSPAWVRRIMPTTAVAAAVAAVSWVVVPQLRGPADGAEGSPALVAKATQGAGAQALTVAAADNTPMIRDARLDEYLSAHRQSATNGMVVPYLRAVANGVANTQDSNQE